MSSQGFSLKPILKEAVPAALERAKHYRLLNEPKFAESICLDVLAVDPGNQAALTMYLLALTDQFSGGGGLADLHARARAVVPKLTGAYERAYFGGIVSERRGHAFLAQGGLGAGGAAYESLREAMEAFEKAGKERPPGNDDAILRYNTCVRTMEQHRLAPHEPDEVETGGD